MKNIFTLLLAGLVTILLLFGLTWMVQGNEFFMYKVFAPKKEQVRREVFEQTKSYKQGMVQEISNMQFEYEQASPEHKAALAKIILHRAADYPENELPTDLRIFISSLKERTYVNEESSSTRY